MPNDATGQFPLPDNNSTPSPTSTTPQIESQPEETKKDVVITDEVAPDLSAPPTIQDAPIMDSAPQPRAPEPEPAVVEPTPVPVARPVEPSPTPSTPVPVPANLPKQGGGFPVVTILLLVISIGAVAATYFFFQQSKTLNSQLSEISQTLDQQKIKENQTTPTPTTTTTPSVTITTTPIATASPTASVSAKPTSSISVRDTGLVFDQMDAILSLAKRQYPDGQLLMVTVSNASDKTQMMTKYWFRQTANTKKYFYVLKEVGKTPTLVDQQIYVTPDNNIPSLNQMATDGKLGIDLNEATRVASEACPTDFDCISSPVSAQYIKANTTLWQISFKPANEKPFIVQIDSITGKILFKSL